ncbi:hypothetical protein QGN23_03725 [Chryseobacterium gotjawalense]|uniref:PsbP C-terminal domain-containing protein n=1 Tax=Chryseobacterium gotjawalense TaxID=3042315 RepID=A0ABY8REJ8_9FLAO|nr:hypothetical protein [Chryseobacterium sp. wdc7]WHF52395.1 hypothetical protein QGN23_03725 [Chryseobacterium sp. wdc7]
MYKISTIFLLLLFCNYNSQIINEIGKEELQKVTTKNHEKSSGLNINISYPADWTKTDGKRPHMLFNFASTDKSIRSTFGITNILESASTSDKKAFSLLSDKDIAEIMTQNFPNSANCSEYFEGMGFENIRNSTCRTTKIEGLKSSVASTFGTIRRAEFSIDNYMVYYQVPYKTNLIVISFNFHNVVSEQDRYLADNLSNKIMNSMIINNLWKK